MDYGLTKDMIFRDIRVLELASVLAGPAVGQFFAELGADVVKVEPSATGDVTRSWRSPGEKEGVSAYFTSVNWGKRSIGLDLKNSVDFDIVRKLVAKADIVITSFRPGKASGLGLSYEKLSEINPEIIVGEINGYGRQSSRLGYDAIIQAESGFMYLNSPPGGEPQKMPVALIDILAAHQLKEALLIAMIRRMKEGKGAFVSVSLMETALASLANQASNYLVGGSDPAPSGSLHPNIAPYGEIFLTGDGRRILLAIGNNRQFNNLLQITRLNELIDDVRFQSNTSRVENRAALFSHLKESIGKMTLKQFQRACEKYHIPVAEILTTGEALDKNREKMLTGINVKGIRTFVAEGLPHKESLAPPPDLNADRDTILAEWLA